MVRPSLVLATGDLTHAKYPGERHSKQFQAEWEEYRQALQKCSLGGLPWLDIRGNHGKVNKKIIKVNNNINNKIIIILIIK